MPAPKGKLTDKQEAFCQEYLIDLNATQAAIRAGYSKNTANEQGAQNLAKLSVAERIAELKAGRNAEIKVTQLEVLKELRNFFYSDVTQTIGLKPSEIKELPIEIRRMVSSYKHTTRSIGEGITEEFVELKFYDKMRVAEMLNRHIGFYEADNKQKSEGYDLSNLDQKQLDFLLNLPRKE